MKTILLLGSFLFALSAQAQFGGNPANFPSTNDQFFQCSKFGNPSTCAKLKAQNEKKTFTHGSTECLSGKVVHYFESTNGTKYMQKTNLDCQ